MAGSEKPERPWPPYKLPTTDDWSPYSKFYHPLQAGSIDGTDVEPHDKGIIRAMMSEYRPNKKVVGDAYRTLFVGRLEKNTKEETLRKEFSRFGEIVKCRLVRDIITGMSRRYALIEFKRERDAREAWHEAYKMIIDNAEILVEYERGRSLKGWIPRRFGGGFGGMKESGQLRFGGRDRPFRKPITLGQKSLFKSKHNRPDFRGGGFRRGSFDRQNRNDNRYRR